ncbi:TIGR00341 family protein [Sulfurimonas sp. HSL3-7]|uniref:TIGR00341 family protein n=1 Tax=Sulfonitrofixus jiaomeiensis TaxID=3131938 RepID=UPI0031F8296F
MYERVILLVGEETDDTVIGNIEEYLGTQYRLKTETVTFSKFDQPAEKTLYLLYLSDGEIRELFKNEAVGAMEVGILPNDLCPYAMRSYGIVHDLFEAIDDVLKATEATPVDLLLCNGLPVIGNIVIGNVHGMNRVHDVYRGLFQKTAAFFSSFRALSFQHYTITTAKGNITSTAATGIMIFEHNVSGVSHNLLRENLSLHDGKLNALILAPASVFTYLYYLFLSYFLNRLYIDRLPKSIGLIISSGLEISSPRPIEYMFDGIVASDTRLTLEVARDGARIYLGRKITDVPAEQSKEEKETIRIQGLPKGEMVTMLASEPVPFFPKADEEDFKELFVGLRQSARISSVFIILMILSTLLATTGLFQNSAPVIIGAMILAPLMAPIVSFSMGVVRGEKELMKESTTTFLVGIVTALVFSCLYAYLLPLNLLTDEMQSRLNPNLLDLMVAIIAGVAGAYAHAKSEVAKSLAGVAIAVALVPPLSVAGIGIGWWDGEVLYGAFLLFMTNLAGITLSAALTFLLLGFAPVRRATKGIVLTTVFLAFVSVPLLFSFYQVIEQHRILTQLKTVEHLQLDGQPVTVRALSVDLSRETPVVYIETRSASMLGGDQLQRLKEAIDKALERPVVVNVLSEIELH